MAYVPRAQLKLSEKPAELQRHAAVLGAVQRRVVLEGVEALAQLRADEEPLQQRVEVARAAKARARAGLGARLGLGLGLGSG